MSFEKRSTQGSPPQNHDSDAGFSPPGLCAQASFTLGIDSEHALMMRFTLSAC